jgi:hypothetical protein
MFVAVRDDERQLLWCRRLPPSGRVLAVVSFPLPTHVCATLWLHVLAVYLFVRLCSDCCGVVRLLALSLAAAPALCRRFLVELQI